MLLYSPVAGGALSALKNSTPILAASSLGGPEWLHPCPTFQDPPVWADRANTNPPNHIARGRHWNLTHDRVNPQHVQNPCHRLSQMVKLRFCPLNRFCSPTSQSQGEQGWEWGPRLASLELKALQAAVTQIRANSWLEAFTSGKNHTQRELQSPIPG